MAWFVIFVLTLTIPIKLFALENRPTLINGAYGLLVVPKRVELGEGLTISIDMQAKKTRFTLGFFSTSFKKKSSDIMPINASLEIDGNSLFLSEFHSEVKLNDISYQTFTKHSIFDIFLCGEYNYFSKSYTIGKKKSWLPSKEQSIKFYAGAGSRLNFGLKKTEYRFYLKDKYLDSIENPLSGSKSSGIKFFLSNAIQYNFSIVTLGLQPAISLPDIKESFLILLFGLTI